MRKRLLIVLFLLLLIALVAFLYGNFSQKNEVSEIDIENTIVKCKAGEQYKGKELLERGLNWHIQNGRIFYKGEQLQKLCDPALTEYEYEMESNYSIDPAYK